MGRKQEGKRGDGDEKVEIVGVGSTRPRAWTEVKDQRELE